jgi:glutathione S-transferase
MVKSLSDAEFEEKVAAIPVIEQQVKWRRAREGFPQDMLDEEMRKIAYSVRKLDDHLANHEWLVPGQYTLADICNFAIANGMQFGFAELVNKADTPHLLRWIEQINERPAVKAMFAQVELEKLGPRE